jgi:hypothetical protein
MSVERASDSTRHPSPRFHGDAGVDRPRPATGPNVLGYFDLVAPVLAAPIVLALGAPDVGYGLGAATWILVRALGLAVERRAGSIADVAQQVSLRLTYRLARVFLLVGVTVLVLKSQGRADGLSALLVITFCFTLHLSLSIIHRPRYSD